MTIIEATTRIGTDGYEPVRVEVVRLRGAGWFVGGEARAEGRTFTVVAGFHQGRWQADYVERSEPGEWLFRCEPGRWAA